MLVNMFIISLIFAHLLSGSSRGVIALNRERITTAAREARAKRARKAICKCERPWLLVQTAEAAVPVIKRPASA